MPYQILKKGKEYILKSPNREYKHKTLAKARAQKKLLEEKEAKVIQTQKVSQKVTVIVNQPRRRRAGQAKKQTVPQQQPIIQMRPSFNPMEAYYAQARPQPRPTLTADESRIKLIEEDIRKLREPFMEQMKQNHLERMSAVSKRDSDLLSRELFQRQLAVERQQEQFMKIKEPDAREMAVAEPIGGGSAISDITQPMSPFPEASAGRDRAALERMTVLELRQILRDRGEIIGKKNKAQLIDAILG
jgi:hypothetical protein